jgi:hypothetical protein
VSGCSTGWHTSVSWAPLTASSSTSWYIASTFAHTVASQHQSKEYSSNLVLKLAMSVDASNPKQWYTLDPCMPASCSCGVITGRQAVRQQLHHESQHCLQGRACAHSHRQSRTAGRRPCSTLPSFSRQQPAFVAAVAAAAGKQRALHHPKPLLPGGGHPPPDGWAPHPPPAPAAPPHCNAAPHHQQLVPTSVEQ